MGALLRINADRAFAPGSGKPTLRTCAERTGHKVKRVTTSALSPSRLSFECLRLRNDRQALLSQLSTRALSALTTNLQQKAVITLVIARLKNVRRLSVYSGTIFSSLRTSGTECSAISRAKFNVSRLEPFAQCRRLRDACFTRPRSFLLPGPACCSSIRFSVNDRCARPRAHRECSIIIPRLSSVRPARAHAPQLHPG